MAYCLLFILIATGIMPLQAEAAVTLVLWNLFWNAYGTLQNSCLVYSLIIGTGKKADSYL